MKIKKYQLSLELLEYFNKQNRPIIRSNVIGFVSQKGKYEDFFDKTLDKEGKALLDIVLGELQKKGLIHPSYAEGFHPGNDLEITDKGRKSLEQKLLDRLDELLISLSAKNNLVEKRYGAYDAVRQKNRDWQSQAANSLVELIDCVLRTIAPKDKVDISGVDKKQKGSIRKEKIAYFLKNKKRNKRKVLEKAFDLIESLRDRLQKVKHSRTESTSEIEQLIKLTEDCLLYLLD